MSIAVLVIATVILGFGYPLVVTGVSQLFFHNQANGSLIHKNGKLVGSALLGQSFTDAKTGAQLLFVCAVTALLVPPLGRYLAAIFYLPGGRPPVPPMSGRAGLIAKTAILSGPHGPTNPQGGPLNVGRAGDPGVS